MLKKLCIRINLLNTLCLFLFVSCIQTQMDNNQSNVSPSDGSGIKDIPTVIKSESFNDKLNKITKILPASFEASVQSKIIISNPSNRNLDDVYINLTDSSGNSYFAGSCLSLKNELKHGPLALGGVSYINIEVSFSGTSRISRVKVRENKPININIL